MLDSVTGATPTLLAAWLASLLLLSAQSPMLGVLTTLGFGGAFVAGLVGMGGAVLMVPLLLYVPPLVALPPLDIHVVSGITTVQVAAAGLTGMLAHRRVGHVDTTLIAVLGAALTLGSLAGGFISARIPGDLLTAVFASLAATAAGLMLRGKQQAVDGGERLGALNRPLAVGLGTLVGVLLGLIGAGGGFLLVPLMVYGLGVPVRTAVGSSLAIVALGGVGGMIGKAVSHQVTWMFALALIVGALPGAHLGATMSRRLSPDTLARILGLLLAFVAVQMWLQLVARLF
ncbi:MAG: sulfite exporter TauE/SafE family protein [Vicinamibacterales bacterium]